MEHAKGLFRARTRWLSNQSTNVHRRQKWPADVICRLARMQSASKGPIFETVPRAEFRDGTGNCHYLASFCSPLDRPTHSLATLTIMTRLSRSCIVHYVACKRKTNYYPNEMPRRLTSLRISQFLARVTTHQRTWMTKVSLLSSREH